MSRYIDADKLKRIKFHPLPYPHIIPTDCESESYKRGWNDAIDAVVDNEPTADVRENVRGEWITTYLDHVAMGERPKILYCSVCNQCIAYPTNYCPNCGASMGGNKNV